jgi:hypothetical protein
MSIVSDNVGYYNLVQPRKKRNFIAVQRAVPDSSIVSETPRQVPNFCISKHIAKPFLYGDAPKCKMGVVPLKSLQEFSHAEGASLFNAPVLLIPEPLKQVIPQRRTIDMTAVLSEIEPVDFQPVFDYKAGIRPSVRRVKLDKVDESDAPFPTRTGTPAPAKLQFGTYDQGKIDYDRLGY